MALLPTLTAIVLLLPAQEDAARSLPGIVATVGNQPITQNELDRRIQRDLGVRMGAGDLQRSRVEEAVLQDMIDELLILQEARRREGGADRKAPRRGRRERGGPVGEEDIDRHIERRIDELKRSGLPITSTQHFYDLEKQRTGLDRDALREDIRTRLTIEAFLWEVPFRNIDPWVTPTQSRHYYQTHLDEFTNPVEVSFRQIFLQPDRFNALLAKQKIDDGLAAGVPFEELAKQYSQDFENPEDRGAIITKTFAEIQHWEYPLPQALRSLEKGEVSDPIITRRAIHYFQIIDRVEGRPKPYEEAQQDIERKVLIARRLRQHKQLVDRLREKTVIRVFLPGAGTGPEVTAEGAPPETTADAGAGGVQAAPVK